MLNLTNNRGIGLYVGGQHASPFAIWMQVADTTNLGVNYPLLLQPNGGNVGISQNTPTALLHLGVANAAVNGTKGVKITNPAGTTLMLECGVSSDSFVGTTSASDFSITTGNAERIKIKNDGRVWINGAISTFDGSAANLQINGFTRTSGQMIFHNSANVAQAVSVSCNGADTFRVDGILSKASGSFRIEHPLDSMSETHELVHSFVESPQANNIYRGKVQLKNGVAQVNLDEVSTMTEGTFVALNTEIHTYTSNETDWDAVRGKVVDNILTIECQNNQSNVVVSWLVIGERHDKHMMNTSWTDENGRVIVEPLKPIKEEHNNKQ
jgi:hypothetical protein